MGACFNIIGFEDCSKRVALESPADLFNRTLSRLSKNIFSDAEIKAMCAFEIKTICTPTTVYSQVHVHVVESKGS